MNKTRASCFERLMGHYPGSLGRHVSLAPYTTWKIGGPAEFFVKPDSVEELRNAISCASEVHLPWRVLGRGSNILVSDAGVSGLVISLGSGFGGLDVVWHTPNRCAVSAGAALALPRLLSQCAGFGVAGLEELAGIPGTVGGAVWMNAGVPQLSVADQLEQVWVFDVDTLCERFLPVTACEFGYRNSRFQREKHVILGAEFRGDRDTPTAIRQRISCRIRARRNKQPWQHPNAGSVFRNPPGHSAGQLIEAAGWKGTVVGGARVSERHANFIINTGSARSDDVFQLIQRIRASIVQRFGIQLILEIQLWGFDDL